MTTNTDYFAGQDCNCEAYYESQCSCDNVDWTDPEIYKLQDIIEKLETELATRGAPKTRSP